MDCTGSVLIGTSCSILPNYLLVSSRRGDLIRICSPSYLFLNEDEKAGSLLSKSKMFEDIILAAKLLKFYQPERAAELAVDGFKRYLPHLSLEDLQDLLSAFPEIKVKR